MTNDEVLLRIAERTFENREQLKKSTTQRRTKFSDLYGIEYLRQGDANNPATFYISISPDFVYYERFAFKLQIMPFVSTVNGISSGGVTGSTSLSGNTQDVVQTINGKNRLILNDPTVTPNPHNHSVSGGALSHGIYTIPTTSTSWRVKIHDVDVTDYLKEQQDGAWITGEGIYPNNKLEDMDDFYDILDVACLMDAEGRTSDVNKLLAQELKKVEIYSDAPFQVAAMVYVKYSVVNR